MREYKDINKRYTDQLVTVKVSYSDRSNIHSSDRVQMSDMANSDLEKYAKALEK
jgi:hypothetical protein